MKKRRISLLSVVLALLLLAGCGSIKQAAEEFVESAGSFSFSGTQHSPGIVHFDDMVYSRPDLDALRADIAAVEEGFASGQSFLKIKRLLDSCYEDYYSYYTMYTLADIRSCQDLTDEYYAAECGWCAENFAVVQQLFDRLYYACAASSMAEELENKYFWEGFVEQYSDAESSYYSDLAVELMQEESALIAEYRALSADPTIEHDGREENYLDVLWELEGEEYDQALVQYYEKYNERFADIFIRLVDVRNRMADVLGFESYEQMQYIYYFERDYSPEQAAGYVADIKEYMVPLYTQVMADDPYGRLWYNELPENELLDTMDAVAGQIGGQVKEAFDFMSRYGLYDVSVSTKKVAMSFQSYLSDYEAPFLFLNPYGDTEDILTLSHEFGHYVDAYVNYDAYETIDVSEIFSQAMEYLTLSRLESAMEAEEAENVVRMKMLDTLELYVQQASFAEFESRVYALGADALSAEVLNDLSLELAREYGYYEEGYEEYYAMSWCDIPHFFEMPFYVITYPVSNDIAMQIYALEEEQSGRGLEKYMEILDRDYEYFMDAVSTGGFESPFAPGRIESVTDQMRTHLALQEKAA